MRPVTPPADKGGQPREVGLERGAQPRIIVHTLARGPVIVTWTHPAACADRGDVVREGQPGAEQPRHVDELAPVDRRLDDERHVEAALRLEHAAVLRFGRGSGVLAR
jgi:hypothetical protein